MATSPSIDALSKDERTLIVYALEAFLVSQRRAERAAKSDSVRAVYASEAAKTQALVLRFR